MDQGLPTQEMVFNQGGYVPVGDGGQRSVDANPEIYKMLDLNLNDPFDSAVYDIIATHRSKRRDYAEDGDPFSNFTTSAELVGLEGFGPKEAVLHLIGVKLARIRSLRKNGRLEDPMNESVDDTLKDIAVYAAILLAIHREEAISSGQYQRDA